MNQKNILPYDGLAYVIDDTEGEFEWPEITACLAETIPWRIETARLFGRDMPVPRMTAWLGRSAADWGVAGKLGMFEYALHFCRERHRRRLCIRREHGAALARSGQAE